MTQISVIIKCIFGGLFFFFFACDGKKILTTREAFLLHVKSRSRHYSNLGINKQLCDRSPPLLPYNRFSLVVVGVRGSRLRVV